MKKVKYIIFPLLLMMVVTACNVENSLSVNGESQFTGNSDINVKGVKNVDVLNSHGSIEGIERMDSFYDNVQNGVTSNLRIVHYTIEGDPIVTDLSFNGETLEVKDDTTRDHFGAGAVTSSQCDKLMKEVNPTNTSYIAVDCDNGQLGLNEILQIDYNMSQQDLFEFELNYGMNQEHEIHTVTQKNADFKMAEDVKQEVYKRLVLANYLAEKDFTTCDTDNFDLKVHINGGQREFRWGPCDQSKDGEKFTDIANYIIEQSEKTHHGQSEVEVQGYVLQKRDNELLIGEGLNMLDYELIKRELPHIDFDAYIFDFIILEGVDTKEFNLGDKVQATLADRINDSKPSRAKVTEINKIEIY